MSSIPTCLRSESASAWLRPPSCDPSSFRTVSASARAFSNSSTEYCAPFPPGTGAEAMAGGLASAGFGGAGPASGLLGVVGTVKILSGARPIYAGLPALVTPHFRQGQGFQIILRIRDGRSE